MKDICTQTIKFCRISEEELQRDAHKVTENKFVFAKIADFLRYSKYKAYVSVTDDDATLNKPHYRIYVLGDEEYFPQNDHYFLGLTHIMAQGIERFVQALEDEVEKNMADDYERKCLFRGLSELEWEEYCREHGIKDAEPLDLSVE